MDRYFQIFLWLCIPHIGFAQSGNPVVIGDTYTIQSKILQEERSYTVSLPASYEGDYFYIDKKYPILIILDGERLFPLASTMVQSMSSGGIEQIPEMIVVGISNSNRNRDFLPDFIAAGTTQSPDLMDGADRFLQFIEEELTPTIRENYRTLDAKILAGHSFGGLFVINALLQKADFDGYLAIDPSLWWQEGGAIKRFEKLVQKKSLKGQLYVSQSNNPFNPGIRANRLGRAVQSFKTALIDKNRTPQLRQKFDFFEKEDHYSVALISLYEGLQFVFEGYKFPLQKIQETSIFELKAHYQKIANRFGGDLLPPGKLLNQVGQFLLNNEEEIPKAIDLMIFNTKSYKHAATPYNSLGNAYEQAGEVALAIENYQKSLAINKDNEQIRARLETLKINR